ncbi:MAG: helix-turn-helix transcriptional regulator [Sedimentisphaerales bacterium]|nr:helix-turn-helix transcriptional regulator [Sedimentisphaerales bacterium]
MINVRLDYLLVDRRMKLKELAEVTGLAVNNLSILKTNKARAIRFSTLESICRALNCAPGDLLEHIPDDQEKPDA